MAKRKLDIPWAEMIKEQEEEKKATNESIECLSKSSFYFKHVQLPQRANEDRYLIMEDFSNHFVLFAVLDGHGNPYGRNGTFHIVDEVIKKLPIFLQLNLNNYYPDVKHAIKATFTTIDFLMYQEYSEKYSCGCTCNLVLIDRKTSILYNANLGDARMILCDDNHQILQTSIDHTFITDGTRVTSPISLSDFCTFKPGYITLKKETPQYQFLYINVARSFGDFLFKQTLLQPYDGKNGAISCFPDIITFDLKREHPTEYYVYISSDAPFAIDLCETSEQFINQVRPHGEEDNSSLERVQAYVSKRTNDDITIVSCRIVI